MKIAILGGSFDPIHYQHLYIANFCTDLFDEVWIMPCYSHPYNKRMSPPEIRLALCEEAIKETVKLYVSDFEIKHTLVAGTYQTMRNLKKVYPEHTFSFIIGQDNADEIHKWINWQLLVTEFSCVVVPRGGHEERGDTWYNRKPHIYLGDYYPQFAISELSSTKIRQLLGVCSEAANEYVPEAVIDKVKELGLYGIEQ